MIRPIQPEVDLGPGDTFGQYGIEAVLGEGAMGKVFRARHQNGETVALKVIKQAVRLDEHHARRFAREARAASEIGHRHIITVFDAGEVDGCRYLTMRYVAGRSLADRIDAEGTLRLSEALRIVTQVASGLDALHAAGVVHRDVKPSNILLDSERGALLTDFGLAKRRDYSTLTRPGQLLGTLHYIAPEALRGQEPGPEADLYALGCVAFECLAGWPPFAAHSGFAVGMAHLEVEPPDPCADRDDVPARFGALVCQALAKHPAMRPATATAYARMLMLGARAP